MKALETENTVLRQVLANLITATEADIYTDDTDYGAALENLRACVEQAKVVLSPKHRKLCCVCGAFAGIFSQHWNRDTGFGICRTCVDWVSTRETPEEMAKLYGIEGVNYAGKAAV